MVAAAADAGRRQVVGQLAFGQHGHIVAGVGTGLIQCHRVKACEHAHIRNDGRIVFIVAVAVGRNVDHQADMEIRPVLHHRFCILGHAAVQLVVGIVVLILNGVEVAVCKAAPAAHAAEQTFVIFRVIDQLVHKAQAFAQAWQPRHKA